MHMVTVDPHAIDGVVYPESDDQPMAENPLQAHIIRTLLLGFERRFRGRGDCWVGGDCFWYPVQGNPAVVTAPDVIVVTGLPAPIDIRTVGSYRQWEHGPAPLLVVEVISPSNTANELLRKRQFYDRHGVTEYWLYDPDSGVFDAWTRGGGTLLPAVVPATGWVSPATGVEVTVRDGELCIADEPGGRRWLAPADEAARADSEAARADAEAARAEALAQRVRELEAATRRE